MPTNNLISINIDFGYHMVYMKEKAYMNALQDIQYHSVRLKKIRLRNNVLEIPY